MPERPGGIPEGFTFRRHKVMLRDGREHEIGFFSREGDAHRQQGYKVVEPKPIAQESQLLEMIGKRLMEDPRYRVGRSLVEAFTWLLGTDEFQDGEADDESRGIEIGNLYAYARAEGLDESFIDRLYEQALSDDEKWADEASQHDSL